jgi:hypothetical protein
MDAKEAKRRELQADKSLTPRQRFRKYVAWLNRFNPARRKPKSQAQLWREQYERERAKYQWPKHIAIIQKSNVCIKRGHIEWAKEQIAKSGLAFVLDHVRQIEIVADPIPTMEGEGGTIDLARRTILIKDMHMIPSWRFPSAILHEGVHIWQGVSGLPLGTRGSEAQAYFIEELFRWRTKCGDWGIFQNNSIARLSMDDGYGFPYRIGG